MEEGDILFNRECNDGGATSYELVEDGNFVIKPPKGLREPIAELPLDKVDKIIKYSSLDNNIGEIRELTGERGVSKFYPDFKPMVIIEECNFYDDEAFSAASGSYRKFVRDFDKVNDLYHRIVDSHIDFMINTGCYFEDVAANNVLVNSNYTEFKIIDVFCIRELSPEWRSMLIEFDPISLILGGKFLWGHLSRPCKAEWATFLPRPNGGDPDYVGLSMGDITLNKFLEGVDIPNFIKNTLDKIDKRRVFSSGGLVSPFQ